MKTKLLSLALAVILAGPAIALANPPAPASVPVQAASRNAQDPAQEIKALARQFRAGDLSALVQGLMPRSRWEMARAAYEAKRSRPTSESDRAEFAGKIQEFTAPDAVDQMMAKIEPELVKARPQLPGMLLMGFGAMQVAIKSPESRLTDAQRKAIEAVMPGLQNWASTTDLLSSATLRRGLTLITDAARRSGITDIDQLKALPLEGVLEQAAPLLVAAKEAVRGYGIDLDAVADSLQVEVLDQGAATARVRTTVTVFGAPVSAEHELVLVEGHWYGKHALKEFDGDFLDG